MNTRASGLFGRVLKLLGRPWVLWCAAPGLAALHVVLVVRHFPPGAWLGEFSLVSGDLPLHFSACHVGQRLLAAGGALWGYAADYMAGYPFGAWDSFTQRGYEYAALLFPGARLTTAFHLYVVLTALLPPFLLAWAARVMGLSRREALGCLGVASLLYQLGDPLAYFWTFGNMGFPFTNAVAVLCLAFVVSGIERASTARLAAAGLLLALVGWLHQMVMAPLLAGAFCILVLQRRAVFTWRGGLRALLAPALAAVLLAPWLYILWRFRAYRMLRETPALVSGWKNLAMDLFSDRAYLHHFDRRALLHVELVLLVVGGLAGWRRRPAAVRVCALTALAAFAFAYLFSYSKFLRQTEPYRYLVSFSVFAAIPVAVGLKELLGWLERAGDAGRVAAVAIGLALAPSLTGYLFDVAGREPAQTLDPEARAVIGWFREHGHRQGRVLCHDDSLADVLPAFTGQEVLGGGMTRVSPLAHKEAWMRGRRLLAASATNALAAEWEEYLNTYNVAYVIVPGEGFAGRLRDLPGWSAAFQPGRRVVYARDPALLSYVLDPPSPSGTSVEAEFNRLHIRGAPAGRFVLKYHYLETLRAPEGVRLWPASVAADPVPFLGVDNAAGLEEIEIRNGALRGAAW